MIYEIKIWRPCTTENSGKVEEVNDEIREILRNMVETMYARDGVGLAAPQVGISLRMFVCDIGSPEESNVKNNQSFDYTFNGRNDKCGRGVSKYSGHL